MTKPHVLILGGTAEARAIAARLALRPDVRVTSSLAGRTERPLVPAGALRTGGFGGADGLARWIAENGVALVVDATHPFAARISANARAAAAAAGVPLVAHERPAWARLPGDRWIDADDVRHAAELLGSAPRRVFLALGRQELAPFDACRQHRYVVRSVEPIPDAILPGATRLLARGPFDEAAERDLLVRHRIECVVAKNSGGSATHAKIAAARALALPVVMVRRPAPPAPGTVASVAEAIEAIHQALPPAAARGA